MNNQQAMGYMIITMQNMGYSNANISRLMDEMYYTFDEKSEYEADEAFKRFIEREIKEEISK